MFRAQLDIITQSLDLRWSHILLGCLLDHAFLLTSGEANGSKSSAGPL